MYLGFSMGAQQAFHWGALHGEKTGGIIPLCGTAKTTTQNWITLEGCKLALQSDVNYNNGDYSSPPKKGLKAFLEIIHQLYLIKKDMKKGYISICLMDLKILSHT